MRQVVMVAAVLIGGGFALTVSPPATVAGALPTVSIPVAVATPIEQAGYWKRRWRRGGYGPDVIMPDADLEMGVDVDEEVTVPGETPPLIVIVPVRPASCGQYRYWNGDRCVDARYHNPYIGPR